MNKMGQDLFRTLHDSSYQFLNVTMVLKVILEIFNKCSKT